MEYWDIVDENRRPTGRTHPRGTPLAPGDYHQVALVWIANAQGQLLISRRHPDKPMPLLWETTGGCLIAGEEPLAGALREVQEELGLILDKDQGRFLYSHKAEKTHTFFDLWLFFAEVDLASLSLQPTEVVDVRWAYPGEIEELVRRGDFIPIPGDFGKVRAALEAGL